MSLEKELQTYENMRESMVAEHKDEFVVIRGEEVLGFAPTLEEALTLGYERGPNEPFLARPVIVDENIPSMPRSLKPCRM